jgi:hypothetical protein
VWLREDKLTQSGEDRVRQANAAFGSGDLGALQSEFLAEDVVWHVPGRARSRATTGAALR